MSTAEYNHKLVGRLLKKCGPFDYGKGRGRTSPTPFHMKTKQQMERKAGYLEHVQGASGG